MAQLDTGGGDKKKGGKVRSKKQSSNVDLTAMVDLAFLLITFFMLTTSLSKPQSMDLGLPDKEPDPTKKEVDLKVDENRTMTILMGDNNKLMYYMGIMNTPMSPTEIKYGRNGIRQEILKRKQSVIAYTGTAEKGLIVLIKPSKKSHYKNLIDVLDEMAISDVPTYAIVDITPPEMEILEGTATQNTAQ